MALTAYNKGTSTNLAADEEALTVGANTQSLAVVVTRELVVLAESPVPIHVANRQVA
jgi:hypothetical protein